MAVYTTLTAADLEELVGHYAIGELEDFRGISEGITNSTYFVDTTLGAWVLTVFEELTHSELPFFMQLMDHLSGHGVPVAHPVARDDGGFLSRIRDRPCALVYRLEGASVMAPAAEHCASLGRVVAEMHRAAPTLGLSQANPRDLEWVETTQQRLAGHLDDYQRQLLDHEIEAQQSARDNLYPTLGRAVIHADLFRDNVLFRESRVSGLIDFFYACDEYLLFDLAVICSDWAFDADDRFDNARWQAFVDAYTRRCPLGAAERRAWPAMLRAVALRFWVSRLVDVHFPRPGHGPSDDHDPAPFERLLRTLSARPTGPARLVIALIQRVSQAYVTVAGTRIAAIDAGVLAFVAAERDDRKANATRLAERVMGYRLFADDRGRMNRSLRDIGGGVLAVPQFTLAADTRRGNRPGFSPAAEPGVAQMLFESFVTRLEQIHAPVASGRFGADMQVGLINDGPVTFWLSA